MTNTTKQKIKTGLEVNIIQSNGNDHNSDH